MQLDVFVQRIEDWKHDFFVLPLTVSNALVAWLIEKGLGDMSSQFVHFVKWDLRNLVVMFNDLMNFKRLELTFSHFWVSQ